ncbi:uncharacterized protein BP5553_02570 [Venustampulla echinocandica]|uniref:Heterokaryon incompatibility domain-containing protein n=1 Tax=Venustampulla echinocandica TaxID=2656787 RepID=A0A370TRS5_9HELO|nr:uncharacterized protein BP5553_02570 [Venustampulla echinocandica]RDL38230.1 hypothetical protein BP5553_02570 [Venustampulla echinocandica]
MAQPGFAAYAPFQHVSCPCEGSRYRYSPLAPTDIRLVILEPGELSDEIFCRMPIFPCHRAPVFEAISYTWGDETERQVVRCLDNPGTLCVANSCASVLRRLRYADRQRYIWIDALCINQQDLQERSLQVKAMAQIYSSAFRVVIYLGESADDSDLAMDFLSSGQYYNMSDMIKSAMGRLLRRPWFERTWVIQEVAMAKSPKVLCGTKSAPWSSLVVCAIKLSLQPPVLSPIGRLRKHSWMYIVTTDQFVKALCDSTACHCRDPRDKVFAFLAMYPSMMNANEIAKYRESGFPMSRARKLPLEDVPTAKQISVQDELGIDMNLWLTPRTSTNYSHSVETVFTEFATLLIENQGLDFLSAMQGRSKPDILPTWVPDWRVPCKRAILAHIPLVQFNAGGSAQSFSTFSPDPKSPAKLLMARAVKIGKIRFLGETCDVEVPNWEHVVFRRWRTLGERAWREIIPSRSPTSFLTAFSQAIFTDSDDYFYQPREALCQKLSNHVAGASIEAGDFIQGIDPSALDRLRISCHGRRFFVDQNGVLGLAASDSLEEDLVYVLLGAKVPYTFRPRRSQPLSEVNLIGECFTRGYMKEEAVSPTAGFRVESLRIL